MSPYPPLGCDGVRLPLFSVTWRSVGSVGQIFCGMSLSLGLVMFFLWLDRVYGFWGGRAWGEVTSFSYYICCTWHWCDISLMMFILVIWQRAVSAGFLSWSYFWSHFHTLLFGKESFIAAHTQGERRGVIFPFSRTSVKCPKFLASPSSCTWIDQICSQKTCSGCLLSSSVGRLILSR